MTTETTETTANKTFKPSNQQIAIFDVILASKQNLIVNAAAGCGKTSTIMASLRLIREKMESTERKIFTAIVCFNNPIANELKEKAAGDNLDSKYFEIGTIHSFGAKAWRRVAPDAKLNNDKLKKLVIPVARLYLQDGTIETEEITHDENGAPIKPTKIVEKTVPRELVNYVYQLVNHARIRAFGIIQNRNLLNDQDWLDIIDHHSLDSELADEKGNLPSNIVELKALAIRWAIVCLRLSNNMAREVIDFTDMVYQPIKGGVRLFQRDKVFVDEAQDLSPYFMVFIRMLLKPGGQVCFVGDEFQAINGFAGADCDSMPKLKKLFNCIERDLTITYRCPQKHVELARARGDVKHIIAAPSAPVGEYEHIELKELTTKFKIEPSDLILCRNFAPLADLYFSLMREGIACEIAGRDMVGNLIGLIERMQGRGKNPTQDLDKVIEKLNDYKIKQTDKLMASGKELAAEQLQDRIDTILAISRGIKTRTVASLVGQINDMFGSEDDNGDKKQRTKLMTVHKAKGKEAERVFLIGANKFMPSRFARQDWQYRQELNLIYVAFTRSKQVLIEVSVPIEKRPRGEY